MVRICCGSVDLWTLCGFFPWTKRGQYWCGGLTLSLHQSHVCNVSIRDSATLWIFSPRPGRSSVKKGRRCPHCDSAWMAWTLRVVVDDWVWDESGAADLKGPQPPSAAGSGSRSVPSRSGVADGSSGACVAHGRAGWHNRHSLISGLFPSGACC